jgi:hypothetical protein
VPTLPIFDERVIWLVPLGLYIFDNFCLVDDRQIIILEDYRFRWTFRLSKIPFVVSGKHLYFMPPLLPYLFAFKLSWLTSGEPSNCKITRYQRRVLIWRSKLYDFRVLAVCSWVNLFVIGPALTSVGGFLFALKYVLPIHIVLLLSCIFLIILNSRLLNFSRRMILSYLVELSLSPGYLPNICRRLSLSYICGDVDGVLFIKQYGRRSTAESMIDVIQFRLAELKTEVDDNPESMRELEKYSTEIRL